ncbi:MAG: hypothetical protein ACYDBV_13790 [Nitrospiria bacterium]
MEERLQSIHPGIRPLLLDFTLEMKSEFGPDLTALILYGSAAGENFILKRSNINLLMVLKEIHLTHLVQYKKRAGFWKKKRIVPPLFCTKEFLAGSKDVFPIEWLDIISHHVLLHGENPFAFTIEDSDIRLQCEKEIREGQIRLRQAFLETGDSSKEIENLALISLNSIFPVLRSVLILQKEAAPPIGRESLIRIFCEKNQISHDHFLKIWSAKKGAPIPEEEILRTFEGYMNDLEQITKIIDELDLK